MTPHQIIQAVAEKKSEYPVCEMTLVSKAPSCHGKLSATTTIKGGGIAWGFPMMVFVNTN